VPPLSRFSALCLPGFVICQQVVGISFVDVGLDEGFTLSVCDENDLAGWLVASCSRVGDPRAAPVSAFVNGIFERNAGVAGPCKTGAVIVEVPGSAGRVAKQRVTF